MWKLYTLSITLELLDETASTWRNMRVTNGVLFICVRFLVVESSDLSSLKQIDKEAALVLRSSSYQKFACKCVVLDHRVKEVREKDEGKAR
ncbi:unnamed protein product [Peronospora farinosa]|uniref:Uncharacterized protein n=1 Tax=Peronospora farinosa TaxID=134698 RepID=A0ABN8CJ33_9STRA|nr:unnamed protein product [Peronospora farinosa]